MKVRYKMSCAVGIGLAAFAITHAGQVQSAELPPPSDACTVLAERYQVGLMSDQDADWLMNRVGCDQRTGHPGQFRPIAGACNREARRLAYLGMDPNAQHFYYYVNEGVRHGSSRDGECTIFEDGSWSDPR